MRNIAIKKIRTRGSEGARSISDGAFWPICPLATFTLLLHHNIYHSIQTYNLSPGPLTMYFWLYFCPLSHQQVVFAIYICTCACICICGCICHFYLWLYYGAICPPSHQVFVFVICIYACICIYHLWLWLYL